MLNLVLNRKSTIMGYFKPLRRKIGVLTLVLACAFAGGWVRSRNSVDLCFLHDVWSNHVFVSGCDKFGFIEGGVFTIRQKMTNSGVETILSPDDRFVGDVSPFRYHRLQATILRVCPSSKNDNLEVAMIPYWSIVIPLTMLSAWLLLLSQSRVAKPIPDLPN